MRCVVFALFRAWQIALGAGILCLAPAVALAQGELRDDFEGPDTAWRVVGADVSYKVDVHARVTGGGHSGAGCEQMRIIAGHGTYLLLGYELGRAPIIDELAAKLWVRCDRPGLQLMVRVVLPRTADRATGKPITTMLRGSSYTQVGAWQQLKVDGLPQLLERQARALRTEHGSQVDTGEAFVDRLIVNAFGGKGITQLALDDLEVTGCVLPEMRDANVLPAAYNATQSDRIKMTGSLLLVDGRPFFPRSIEHRGEPLAYLKQLGFNVIQLSDPPSREMLDEAARQGMWLMCPPPLPPTEGDGQELAIGPEYDWVLAWYLGDRLSGRDLQTIGRWTERIRHADQRQNRPIVAGVTSELRSFSRHLDALCAVRTPLATSLELTDYGVWLRERPRLARPGTPFWCQLPTDLPLAAREQIELLGGNPNGGIESEPIRLVVYSVLSAGVRGMCFQSDTRLDDTSNPDSVRRSMILELLNLELDLIEPWASSGKLLAMLPGSDPEIHASLLQSDRARLLLPVWAGKQAQFVPGQSSSADATVVAPVPESYKAYEITPCELKLLKHSRVAGGMRVVLGEFGLSAAVLMTQDPLVLSSLAKKTPQIAARAAKLNRDLAMMKLELVTSVSRQLAGLTSEHPATVNWLSAARTHVDRCDRALATGNFPSAYIEAARAMRPLRLLQRAHFEAAATRLPPPVTTPFTSSFATLPAQWQFIQRIGQSAPGPNQMPAGDCETLDRMLNAGWRHLQHPHSEVLTEVELSPVSPHSGKFSLRMKAAPVSKEEPPGQIESPPVWITTAGVPAAEGQLFRIHGWVRVPVPIVASIDGLTIIDSLSGETLCERVGHTNGWQEFTMYRAAPRAGTLSVTFALTGLGEAWVDDVTVEPINLNTAPPARTATRPTAR